MSVTGVREPTAGPDPRVDAHPCARCGVYVMRVPLAGATMTAVVVATERFILDRDGTVRRGYPVHDDEACAAIALQHLDEALRRAARRRDGLAPSLSERERRLLVAAGRVVLRHIESCDQTQATWSFCRQLEDIVARHACARCGGRARIVNEQGDKSPCELCDGTGIA